MRHFLFSPYRLKLLFKPRFLELKHFPDVTGRYLQFALLNWSDLNSAADISRMARGVDDSDSANNRIENGSTTE